MNAAIGVLQTELPITHFWLLLNVLRQFKSSVMSREEATDQLARAPTAPTPAPAAIAPAPPPSERSPTAPLDSTWVKEDMVAFVTVSNMVARSTPSPPPPPPLR